MKNRLLAMLALGMLLLGALIVPNAQAAGGGSFWVYSGSNGTGEARHYDILPESGYYFGSSVRYNINCSGTCDLVNNSISSIKFSCGASGYPIDQSDTVSFYNGDPFVGTAYTYNPNYPDACSNGVIVMNLASNINNAAGSLSTNE